jgi:glycosyltransferase involved in cell wall biosynthesis
MRVLLMDFWSLVPYYTIALAKGLSAAEVHVTAGSTTYDLDPECFDRAGLTNDPGLLDLIGRRRIASPALRRILKLTQGIVNLAAWSLRFIVSRPDIIHVQQLRLIQARLPLELWFLRFARMRGCRIVYTVHNLLPHDTGLKHRAPYFRLYHFADALICHSPDVREKLRTEFRIDPAKIRVVPHGPLFAPDEGCAPAAGEEREPLVLCQGFLRPYKGIEFLIESWRKLISQYNTGARLVIAGSGEADYIAHLQKLIRENGLESSVTFRAQFLSPQEVASLYRTACVVVYPYREITTSGALMTGVANAKAIITTDLRLFRDTLRHGHNALLVPYGDADAFASALQKLIADPCLRRQLGTHLAELNSTSSWTGIGASTRACYASLLEHTRSGAPSHSTGERPSYFSRNFRN